MTLFDSASGSLVRNTLAPLPHPVQIGCILTGRPEDGFFKALSGELTQLCPNLSIPELTRESGLPGLFLKDRILYSARPAGRELEPFLLALALLSGHGAKLSQKLREDLGRIQERVRLTLYITPECPFCPAVVSTVMPLALESPNIHLNIIDGFLFPESAAKDQVMSAPCLILDDRFRWTGQISADEILSVILSPDLSSLSSETLRKILEQGDAARITKEMVRAGRIFENFARLLLHETWSVRLGAMVVAEELAETAPGLAKSLCPLLMERFDGADIPTRGDILYALGLCGDAAEMAWIKAKLPSLGHEDLIDAAREALDTLGRKE